MGLCEEKYMLLQNSDNSGLQQLGLTCHNKTHVNVMGYEEPIHLLAAEGSQAL